MLRKWTCLLAIAGGCLLLTAPSEAQKQKKVETPKEQIQEERLQKLVTALDLAAQGRDKNAPEYLITAAGMLRQLSTIKDLQNMKKLDVKVEVTGDKATVEDKEATMPSLKQQSDDLFKEASDMGATQGVNVDKLIKLAKTRAAEEESKLPEEQRALVGGPRQIGRFIGPGQVDSFQVTFIHGFPNSIAFSSNRMMRLTVVRDSNDNVVVDGVTTSFQRGFPPHPVNRNMIFRVRNTSNQRGQYQLFIN